MNEVLFRARGKLYDCTAISKMLRAMVQSAEEKASIMKKQTTFLRQLAANTLPKNFHCFSLQLTINYYKLPNSEREFPGQDRLGDNSLFHYAIFSNNILATSVVVNSAASNAEVRYRSNRASFYSFD
jgi:alpha-1,4-galacturonosyltransferase